MIQDFLKLITRIVEILTNIILIVVDYTFWLYNNSRHGISDSLVCLEGKTAIVTGGNSGIGFMTAKLLASRGCKVIIACRRKATKERDEIIEETNNPNIIVKCLDLSNLASVRQFAENIRKEEEKLDILINNAGIGYSDKVLTEDGLDQVMQANYIGHFLLTHLLIDLLKAAEGARIVFLTSGLSLRSVVKVEDLYPKLPATLKTRFNAYSNSKLLNILVAQEMAKKLDIFGIKVNAADPGVVRTPIFEQLEGPEDEKFLVRWLFKLINFFIAASVTKAANTSFHLAASKDVGSGLLYFRCVSVFKPKILTDEDVCAKIWKETEKIVKLRPEEKL